MGALTSSWELIWHWRFGFATIESFACVVDQNNNVAFLERRQIDLLGEVLAIFSECGIRLPAFRSFIVVNSIEI